MPAKFKLTPYVPKKHYVPKRRKTEESVQRRVCAYIRNHYPSVYFRSDTASGMMLSYHQAMIHHSQQSGSAQPDLMVFYPNFGYHGLLIELKSEGVRTHLKKGGLVADVHIKAQAKVLSDMNELGYFATFAHGYDEAVAIINKYMGMPDNEVLKVF